MPDPDNALRIRITGDLPGVAVSSIEEAVRRAVLHVLTESDAIADVDIQPLDEGIRPALSGQGGLTGIVIRQKGPSA